MAIAAFWIALAAVLVARSWKKKSIEQLRHETVRQLIQKESSIDPEMVRELLSSIPKLPKFELGMWGPRRCEPGQGYRHMRIWGNVFVIAGPGFGAALGALCYLVESSGVEHVSAVPMIVLGVVAAIAFVLLGLALVYSSRFLPKGGPDDENANRRTA